MPATTHQDSPKAANQAYYMAPNVVGVIGGLSIDKTEKGLQLQAVPVHRNSCVFPVRTLARSRFSSLSSVQTASLFRGPVVALQALIAGSVRPLRLLGSAVVAVLFAMVSGLAALRRSSSLHLFKGAL